MRPALALGLTFCLTLLILLGLEGGTRIWGPPTLAVPAAEQTLLDERGGLFPYVNRAGYQGKVWGAPVSINTHHLRGPALANTPAPRLLLLGDSVIFGPGLQESEAAHHRWPSSLLPVPQVLNAGTLGYATPHQRAFLETFGETLQPDVVVLAYCLNDPLPAGRPSLILEAERAIAWKQKLRSWLDRHSAFYLLLRGTLKLNWANYRYPAVVAPLYTQTRWDPVAAELQGIQQWCAQRAIPFALVVFPYQDQLVPDRISDDQPQRRLQAFADAHGVQLLDLRSALTADDYLYYDPLHLNAQGMQKSMSRLAAFVQPLLSSI